MTMIKKALLAAALAVPAIVAAAPAQAQVSGIAVADLNGAVERSKAWVAAKGQIETTYAAQIAQARTRQTALQAELQPLVTAFETARRAPNANEATLRTQAQTIQTRQQAGQQELQRISAPFSRAQAYAVEQIQAKLNDAVTAAVRARNVTLLLNPEGVMFAAPAADITAAVTTELDRLVPSVSIAVPANWQPGQQQAAAPAGTPAAPARPAQGR